MKSLSMIAAGLALSLVACGGSSNPGGPDAGAGACSLVGTWNVTGAQNTTWTGEPGGTSILSLNGAGTITETYAVSGSTVSFTDQSATGAGTAQKCDASVVGQYTMAFASDCKMVTFALASDACAQRAQVVNHLSMTRP